MKVSRCVVLTLGVLISVASGCSEPTQPEGVSTPPPAAPPSPPSPLNTDHIAGVYDLTATITSFDPAWGDLTGHRYIAVLTLADGLGTFTDFRLLNAEGESLFPSQSGSVTREVDFAGRLVLYLGSSYRPLIVGSIAKPDGDGLGSPRVEGGFGAGGHISGTFVATRRTP
ncbi:hypothetical protein BH23GEM2_BH23GEM2_25990 [soil metagenome]